MPQKTGFSHIRTKTKNLQGNVKLALILIAIVFLWMLSGIFMGSQTQDQSTEKKHLKEVAVLDVDAQPYTRYLRLSGQIEPVTTVDLAARTESQVVEVLKDKGEQVQKGDVLMRLEKNGREEHLNAARLNLNYLESLYESALELNEQGYRSDTSLDELKAQVAAAQETLKKAEDDLSYTEITSPIQGLVENRMITVGDYVKVGEPAYQIISENVYKITGNLSQKDRSQVKVGTTAFATLASGEEVSGTITFIASKAHNLTRTYRLEAKVYSEQHLPTGMSANLLIPGIQNTAYLVPYAALVLNDEGNLGTMIVNNEDKVQFAPINPLDDNGEGFYLTGYKSDKVRVVVTGQNSLKNNEEVKVNVVNKAPIAQRIF